MKKVCIVIPIHSSEPTQNELISFKQCFKILGKHPIFIVAPENLNLLSYKEIISTFNVIYINPKWQSSILNYNKLKLSNYFYSLFNNYEYLLTYELDAFVFKDELLYWCEKNYDYIGAPWFEGFTTPTNNIIGVGNSGFSLRKTEKIKRCINKVVYKDPLKEKRGNKKKYITLGYQILQRYFSFFLKENITLQRSGFLFEDRIICDDIAVRDNSFKLGSIENAISFSFETNPAILYKLNGNKLPFGCHAWNRYDKKFWAPYVKDFGYKIN